MDREGAPLVRPHFCPAGTTDPGPPIGPRRNQVAISLERFDQDLSPKRSSSSVSSSDGFLLLRGGGQERSGHMRLDHTSLMEDSLDLGDDLPVAEFRACAPETP